VAYGPIPRLGLVETTVAKLYVLHGEWPAFYRAMLKKLRIERPPAHLVAEIRVMQERRAAGDENWRDGTRRRAG
jgi:hypothetical protein